MLRWLLILGRVVHGSIAVLQDGPGCPDFCSFFQVSHWTLTLASAWGSRCLLAVAFGWAQFLWPHLTVAKHRGSQHCCSLPPVHKLVSPGPPFCTPG